MKKKIVYIIGTRPEIIRSATLIPAFKSDPDIDFKLVHTGQHYDYEMNKIFFEDLGLPEPDINLNVGSGTHGEQTANIILRLEKYFEEFKPDMVGVFGDTNSSLAAGITAVKMNIPLAHIEAGCREWEMDMPEEINRRLLDHCSNVMLTVSDISSKNLEKEHVAGDIKFVGDPLFEVYEWCTKNMTEEKKILEEFDVKEGEYAVLTAHRAKNVDTKESLQALVSAVGHYPDLQFVFPVHPRTKARMDELNVIKDGSNIKFIRSLSYREIVALVEHSKLVVTDSGGLQKEAFWSKKPCVILRDHTAWLEPIEYGVSFLAKCDESEIKDKLNYIMDNYDELQKKYVEVGNPYDAPDISQNIIREMKAYAGKRW